MKYPSNIIKSQQGVSLIMVLIMLTTAGLLAGVFMQVTLFNINFSQQQLEQKRAHFAAQAGIEHIKANIDSIFYYEDGSLKVNKANLPDEIGLQQYEDGDAEYSSGKLAQSYDGMIVLYSEGVYERNNDGSKREETLYLGVPDFSDFGVLTAEIFSELDGDAVEILGDVHVEDLSQLDFDDEEAHRAKLEEVIDGELIETSFRWPYRPELFNLEGKQADIENVNNDELVIKYSEEKEEKTLDTDGQETNPLTVLSDGTVYIEEIDSNNDITIKFEDEEIREKYYGEAIDFYVRKFDVGGNADVIIEEGLHVNLFVKEYFNLRGSADAGVSSEIEVGEDSSLLVFLHEDVEGSVDEEVRLTGTASASTFFYGPRSTLDVRGDFGQVGAIIAEEISAGGNFEIESYEDIERNSQFADEIYDIFGSEEDGLLDMSVWLSGVE